MIRPATVSDMAAIMDMVARLHEATAQAVPLHRAYAESFVLRLMGGGGLVAVLDLDGPAGVLIASVGLASVSPVPVAVEHAWWVEPRARGHGRALLAHYEAWARSQGCRMVRMSSREMDDKAAVILRTEGFLPVEIAWAKEL